MKNLTAKYGLLLLLAGSFAGVVEATSTANGDDCCRSSCYECSCEPLYPCAWDVQLQAGVAPILWRNRGELHAVNCLVSSASPAIKVLDIPKFNKLFRLPWTIGGQIGYAWDCNTRLYAEFDYAQSRRKCTSIALLNLTPTVTFAPTFSKYQYYNLFVGARYYWDRWCDRVSPFLGAKVGLVHHKRVIFSNLAASTGENSGDEGVEFNPQTAGCDFFCSTTKISGGANIGLDICFCGNWSLVLTAEVVANCGPCMRGNLVLNPLEAFNFNNSTNLLTNGIGTELQFPLTVGVRYSF